MYKCPNLLYLPAGISTKLLATISFMNSIQFTLKKIYELYSIYFEKKISFIGMLNILLSTPVPMSKYWIKTNP